MCKSGRVIIVKILYNFTVPHTKDEWNKFDCVKYNWGLVGCNKCEGDLVTCGEFFFSSRRIKSPTTQVEDALEDAIMLSSGKLTFKVFLGQWLRKI